MNLENLYKSLNDFKNKFEFKIYFAKDQKDLKNKISSINCTSLDYSIDFLNYQKSYHEMNVKNMIPQALALDQYAKKDVKVIVVANPANTNCLVALSVATTLNPSNFSCLTRLDHERLRSMISLKTKVPVSRKIPYRDFLTAGGAIVWLPAVWP